MKATAMLLVSCVLVAMLGACRPRPDMPPLREWVEHETGNTMLLVPPDYRERREGGISLERGDYGTPGWRRLSARVFAPGEGGWQSLRPSSRCTRERLHGDCLAHEDYSVETVTINGCPTVVERAKVTGGFAHVKEQPQTQIYIRFRDGRRLGITAQLGNEDGYAEILEIASATRCQ